MSVLKRFVLAVLLASLVAVVTIVESPRTARVILPATFAALLPPALPEEKPIQAAHWLDQNWSNDDSQWYHHANQGTDLLPIRWFLAFEQPELSLFSAPGLLSDSAYLTRMGFIPSEKVQTMGTVAMGPSTGLGWQMSENDAGLPVGFARTKSPGNEDRVGLTCSACHTGHIEYKGKSIRFNGGPAMLNINLFEQAVSVSILYTLYVPGRFDRFADRVLGAQSSAEERKALRDQLSKIFSDLLRSRSVTNAINAAKGLSDTPEGFARLDALNRIGNRVFYFNLGEGPEIADNYHAVDAPVRFPALWTTPWFKFAEYDASIEQPLVRNVGEAMGVGASVTLEGDKMFKSSVALDNLIWIEDMLRGPDPFATPTPAFSGLTAPKWPHEYFQGDAGWALDPAKVTKGRALYAELCASCHLGPTRDPEFDKLYPDKAFWSSPAWIRDAKAPTLLLKTVPVKDIGTDPAQADVLFRRMVILPPRLGLDHPGQYLNETWACSPPVTDPPGAVQPFALALMASVEKITHRWLKDHNASAEDTKLAFGAHTNCPNPQPGPMYRARPLDGVWAMAPYLHNGSVPSLDMLLRPAAQRPQKFCLGGRDYDPRIVGFDASAPCAEGESLFAVTDKAGQPIKGNSNAGHSFDDGGGSGVVGRALSDAERSALIDYLKTL